MRNKNQQLELPLDNKFKKRQRVKILGLDSTGFFNYKGAIGQVLFVGIDGVVVYFPNRFPSILSYSVWEIEKI